VDHYAEAAFSEPGRCWRMVQQAGVGAPAHCSEPVVWVGNHQLSGGKQIRVWSCRRRRGDQHGFVEIAHVEGVVVIGTYDWARIEPVRSDSQRLVGDYPRQDSPPVGWVGCSPSPTGALPSGSSRRNCGTSLRAPRPAGGSFVFHRCAKALGHLGDHECPCSFSQQNPSMRYSNARRRSEDPKS
jgi:hypothetical protein